MAKCEWVAAGRMLAVGAVAAIIGWTMSAGPAAAQAPQVKIPFLDAWASSPHAKRDAEAFVHWDKEGAVPEACARCHTTTGFQDFLGADGSAQGKVDQKAPTGQVVECVACHNSASRFLSTVTFPSGITVGDLGGEARCMVCHQGRASTVSVTKATEGIADDAVSANIKFVNIHYRAAAATRYGTVAKGGYEYAGKAYHGFYMHDDGARTCTDCHSPHTTRVGIDDCSVCHPVVRSAEDFTRVRKLKADADGDGDTQEGIADEIDTLHKALLAAIQAYGKEVAGKAIAYHSHAFPYFFVDTDGNGTAEDDEAQAANGYNAWTPRLLRAAYNYQFVAKDPGAYVHNPVYVVQILHDSLADLGSRVSVAMNGMARP